MTDMFRPKVFASEGDPQGGDVLAELDALKSQLAEKTSEMEDFKRSVQIKDVAVSMGVSSDKIDGILKLVDRSSDPKTAVENVKKNYPELFVGKISSAKVGATGSGETSAYPDLNKMTQSEYNKYRKNFR